eukprot:GHVU01116702.1.p3 GENE.GHVU01116702.1~~GHVU01116702.1.p3  ORF type:complete len:122 (+),score=6.40 GHVU01116702.1:1366-1731(+)
MCGGTDRMSVYTLPQKCEIMGCFTEGSPADLFAPRTVNVGNSAWACVDECERVGYHYAGIISSGPRIWVPDAPPLTISANTGANPKGHGTRLRLTKPALAEAATTPSTERLSDETHILRCK